MKYNVAFKTDIIRKVFEEQFPKRHNISLDDIEPEHNDTWIINKNGWTILVIFATEKNRGFIEFYACHRMTGDSHKRIYENGTIDQLPAHTEWIVFDPNVPNSQEESQKKFIQYNEQIKKDLKEKGLVAEIITIDLRDEDILNYEVLQNDKFNLWNDASRIKLIEFMKKKKLLIKPNIYTIYPKTTFEKAKEIFKFEKKSNIKIIIKKILK